jgi:WD40 repeat protein
LKYLDFELEIGPGAGGEYPLAVVRSPAGEARATLRFPVDTWRAALAGEEGTIRSFGAALFEALMAGEVRSRYDVSRDRASLAGRGLRIKLRIQPPELAVVPWEYLYDARQAEFLCLSRATSIVRYLDLPLPVPSLAVAPPLRVLALVASPEGLAPINLERERYRIETAVADLRARGLVELHWLPGQTWRDLRRALRGGPWHIFHFMGHGGFDEVSDEGFIALADEQGEVERLGATQLAMLLADHNPLRLVLLNACEGARGSGEERFSSTAATLVRRGIPAVLAMQHEITGTAAVEFARDFYESLAAGLPVDGATSEARKAVRLTHSSTAEWGAPVLFMRSTDGALFDLAQPPRAGEEPAPQPEAPLPGANEPAPGIVAWPQAPSAHTGVTQEDVGVETPDVVARRQELSEPATAAPEGGEVRVELVRVLAGHEHGVLDIAFSPDATILASGAGRSLFSRGKGIKLWQVADGILIRTLEGHRDQILKVSFTPDGRVLASRSVDNTVRLWRVADGQILQTITGHRGKIWGAELSPDGAVLAVSSDDGIIRMWRVADGSLLYMLQGRTDSVSMLSFSPDGRLLAFESGNRTIRLWRASDGQLLQTVQGDWYSIRSVTFSPDAEVLAAIVDSGWLLLWRVSDGKLLRKTLVSAASVWRVFFSPDGSLIASQASDEKIRLLRVVDGKPLHELRWTTKWATRSEFSPDGRLLASLGDLNRSIQLWRVADGRLLHTLTGHSNAITRVAFSPDGALLASASYDRTVRLWRIERG